MLSRSIATAILVSASAVIVTPSVCAQDLRSPVRVAIAGPSGIEVIVSDSAAQRVFVLDRLTLKPIRTFPVKGKPLGVAAYKNLYYVGNETAGRVQIYNKKGRWVRDLPGPEGAFRSPTDIAVDEALGLLFILDGQAKTIKVFDDQDNFLRLISSPGYGAENLTWPTGIAVDKVSREVFVSDYGDPEQSVKPRIQIFDYEGNHLGAISGTKGMLGLRFSRPQGLATDGDGHVFVVDSLAGEVLIFDQATGRILGTLGSFGSGPGQLQLPLDCVLESSSNDLLVTNNRPGRIEVFRRVLPARRWHLYDAAPQTSRRNARPGGGERVGAPSSGGRRP